MNARRPVIVGATGSLGRMLDAEARARGFDPVAAARSGGRGRIPFDVLRNDLLDAVPDLGPRYCVYLTFGLTNPNWVHAHAEEARMVNVNAAKRILDQALDHHARAVFISSEQVFDGQTGGYDEDSLTNPVTEYGRQKAEVETHLLGRGGDWVIVRAGATVTENLGENCAVEKTYSTLLKPDARIATDNIFSLTPARAAISALLALAERGERGVYHFAAEPPVSRVELARWILEDSRFSEYMRFAETTYESIPFPEPRPLRSYMIGPRTYTRLGMAFPSAREAVRKKVTLLDSRFEADMTRSQRSGSLK